MGKGLEERNAPHSLREENRTESTLGLRMENDEAMSPTAAPLP